ncbi:aromatic acid exporter family protein [Streptomyces sp. NPDC049813]|uniref:aromatic acid exporter family protein n=1 Tax=Streptomyces sp. NPDC049813 TaxID=3365597 RepID=UPI0037872AE0
MREATDPLLNLVRRGKEPAVVQTVRSTAAAVISYVVAVRLSSEPVPLTAPLTALLVVQVTLFATIRTAISRVNAVVAGVLIAIGFSALVGLTWWSLGLIILAALTIGRFVKAGDFLVEVAISAMLVLGVTQAAGAAWDRVLETLIGAVVGFLFNTLFVPPVWVSSASESLLDLSRRMAHLTSRMHEQLSGPVSVEEAASRLYEARRLDNDIADVDAALRQAEDSLRLNPRVKEGLLSRVVLRTGLDTLEICSVVLRVSTRTLTDLAKARAGEPLFPPHVSAAIREMYDHLGGAFQAFAVLITSQVSANAEDAESRLTKELAAGRESRDRLAAMLLDLVRDHPGQWQLHGALLAEADRILDEMDVDKRSARLVEELDLRAREMQDKHPRLTALRRSLRGFARRLRRR